MMLEPPANVGRVELEPTALPEAASKPAASSASTTRGASNSASSRPPSSAAPSQAGPGANAGRRDDSQDMVLLVSGLGVAVLGAGLGTLGLVTAVNDREEATALVQAVEETAAGYRCTGLLVDIRCVMAESKRASASTLTLVSVGSFLSAAAGGALAVYELARMKSATPGAPPRVAVGAAPGGATVLVTGSF